jgi:hypothetical protein
VPSGAKVIVTLAPIASKSVGPLPPSKVKMAA